MYREKKKKKRTQHHKSKWWTLLVFWRNEEYVTCPSTGSGERKTKNPCVPVGRCLQSPWAPPLRPGSGCNFRQHPRLHCAVGREAIIFCAWHTTARQGSPSGSRFSGPQWKGPSRTTQQAEHKGVQVNAGSHPRRKRPEATAQDARRCLWRSTFWELPPQSELGLGYSSTKQSAILPLFFSRRYPNDFLDNENRFCWK